MNRWVMFQLTMFALALVMLGCADAGSPLEPFSESGTIVTQSQEFARDSHAQLWGYWDVYLDPENRTAEPVLRRHGMFAANVVTFLNDNPTCLGFDVLEVIPELDYLDVDIDVSLRHPFPGMQQFNGYDVRGIFMGDGSATMGYSTDLDYPVFGTDQFMMPDPDDPVEGNGAPDGYTRWFNKTEFGMASMPLFGYTQGKFAAPAFDGTATLCPYKYFADGLQKDEDLWEWLNGNADQNGEFKAGEVNIRNYYLRFPNGTSTMFGYAVVANWKGPLPEDHPSNAPEAVAIDIEDSSTVYFVDPATNGGDMILDISVWDWGVVSAGVGDCKIFIESTVLSSVHECTPDQMNPAGGTENYSTYHVEIPADAVTSLEGNEFWVIVEYQNHDYTNEFDAINDAWEDSLAAFFRYDLEVSPETGCTDPIITAFYPDTAVYGDFLDDAEIVGDEMELGPSLAAYLTDGTIDIVGTEITWQSSQLVTGDFDLDAGGAVVGLYDLHFIDGDGCEVVLENAIELTECPDPFFFTDFEQDEVDEYGTPESENWTRYTYEQWNGESPDYWSCEWFEGHINCREETCTDFGQPCGGQINAAATALVWRTDGILIPECWGDDTIELAVEMEYDATCVDFRNRYRMEYSDDGVTWPIIFSYDVPYNYTSTALYWYGDLSLVTAHFNFDDEGQFYAGGNWYEINPLEFQGGDTVWIRIRNYGALYFCCPNNTPGFTVHSFKLGSPE